MKFARHRWLLMVAMAMAFTAPGPRVSAAAPATENEIKAVLLFHITQFVKWPTNADPSPEFLIGVMGSDALAAALDAVVKDESVNQRPIRVVRSDNPNVLRECALVYISPTIRPPLARAISEIKRGPMTLIVGETEDLLDEGGHIRLRQTPARKIRLQIHLGNARGNGFQVSAQLLRVSDVVGGSDG